MRHESDRYRPIEGLELEMRDRLATKDAEITRLKADVTNRDEAIERMRRERSARVMGAHMDRVEAALGFQGGKPVIIDMVIARIEQLNAALARVRGQRDKALIALVPLANGEIVANGYEADEDDPGDYEEWVEDIAPDDVRSAESVLSEFRILDQNGVRTVEEIES